MWGACGCFAASGVKEDDGPRPHTKVPEPSLGPTTSDFLRRDGDSGASSADCPPAFLSENERKLASFQAVCKTFERGVYDPARPSGKPGDPDSSPPVPGTPSPNQSRATAASGCTDPKLSGASQASAWSEGLLSAGSRVRSEASTGRPQPVHELQQLLFGGSEEWTGPSSPGPNVAALLRSGGRAPSGGSSKSKQPPAGDSKATGSNTRPLSRSSSKTSTGSGGKPKAAEAPKDAPAKAKERPVDARLSWLRSPAEVDDGSSGRLVGGGLERQASEEIEDMSDPLEGHPYYQIMHQLNPGSSGSVYHCVDLRCNEEVAIKMVSRGVANARAAEREIANLRLCALHPYIIHMHEVFLTSSHLAIVFEYASGGNLANYIETFQSSKHGRGISEERTRWIFQQIVVAVDFCHKMGIANRDIKLENVLLVPASSDPSQPPIAKLCDFGFSKDENADSVCKTACGTPECVAPEVLTGELYDGKSSDIWSMGVLLYAMLTGTFPFSRPSDDLLDNTASLRTLFHRIANVQYPRPAHLSKHALDLLDRMLQQRPQDRITVDEILRHPWFGKALHSVARSVNKGLLEMPDSMLIGFARQSDTDIADLLQVAAQRTHSGIL